MRSGAPSLEARTKAVINPDDDGGQHAGAGRLFVLAGHCGRRYAAIRSVAVRISDALRLLLCSWLKYFRYYL